MNSSRTYSKHACMYQNIRHSEKQPSRDKHCKCLSPRSISQQWHRLPSIVEWKPKTMASATLFKIIHRESYPCVGVVCVGRAIHFVVWRAQEKGCLGNQSGCCVVFLNDLLLLGCRYCDEVSIPVLACGIAEVIECGCKARCCKGGSEEVCQLHSDRRLNDRSKVGRN